MTQPPDRSDGSASRPDDGWSPGPAGQDWGADPTQQLPSGQQYPPTQPLPAGDPYPPTQQYPAAQPHPGTQQYPAADQSGWAAPQPGGYGAAGQYGSAAGQYGTAPGLYGTAPGQPGSAPGQYGSTPGQYGGSAPGQPGSPPGGYGTPGQYGQPGGYGGAGAGGQPGYGGQYGSGGYVPPGGPGGAPPTGGYGGPPPGGGGKRNMLPMLIGIVAGVLVLGLGAWYVFARPGASAVPSTSPSAPIAPTPAGGESPSSTPMLPPAETPSGSPSASPRPSGSANADCSPDLFRTQCDWAVYLKKFVVVDTCKPDPSDRQRDAFTCEGTTSGIVNGPITVTMRWANTNSDLTKLMDDFFKRAGVKKSQLNTKDWKRPPAHTNWWWASNPKQVLGKLGSAQGTDGTARVAWTFSKQKFFIEAVSERDTINQLLEWWAQRG